MTMKPAVEDSLRLELATCQSNLMRVVSLYEEVDEERIACEKLLEGAHDTTPACGEGAPWTTWAIAALSGVVVGVLIE